MRLVALLFAAVLTAAAAAGADSQAAGASAQKDAQPLDLPVSLDKIRDALNQKPLLTLSGLREQAAHFRVEIEERRKIEELLATLDFKTGPTPASGIYGREQQRLTNPAVTNPLAQPYAGFNTGELLTIAIQNLVGKYLGGRALNAVSNFERARAERAAREEVARAMAEFCAAQPNNGAGLQACSIAPAVR